MKALVKQILKVIGHALTVSVHERLDHTDHALDTVIDQNNRMARTQTALLQSSIHLVNTLNRVQADLTVVKRHTARLARGHDALVETLNQLTADVTEAKDTAEEQVSTIESGQSRNQQ